MAGQSEFAECRSDLQQQARTAGISDHTVNEVLAQVQYVERVIELDRQQPEFSQTFADYFSRRVTPARVEKGRELLVEHGELLARVQQRTGVPSHYLVAFWGLETNFGSFFGNMPAPDSLATLACDERRSRYFTGELIAALQILDSGDIGIEQMVGSWAGALGHVQFMPSTFLKYAVDEDGDGRRDLWGSVPDAMASAGNFLQQLGWVRALRWGREVRLPENFDFSLIGREKKRPLTQWVEIGVTNAFGDRLPPLNLSAAVLLPAGHQGPAFLTYRNFDVIMGWNRSEHYALAVGRLADRIAGAGRLIRPLPDDGVRLARADVIRLQSELNALGFALGAPDGILGPATRGALSRFQHSSGLVADGHLDQELIDAVSAAVRSKRRG
ncbi:MAG: lytic murein transglycosylase [Gammaproteobacteria bacterium]|nr:lytic murein transglycosylase [Gammaproteobacteria bacterium]